MQLKYLPEPTALAELQVSLIVNGTGCSDTSVVSVDLVYSSTEVFSSGNSVICYPNPFQDILNIQSNRPVQSISIFNMTGKEFRIVQNNIGLPYLDLSSLPAGLYTLMMEVDNMWETIKLLKE